MKKNLRKQIWKILILVMCICRCICILFVCFILFNSYTLKRLPLTSKIVWRNLEQNNRKFRIEKSISVLNIHVPISVWHFCCAVSVQKFVDWERMNGNHGSLPGWFLDYENGEDAYLFTGYVQIKFIRLLNLN